MSVFTIRPAYHAIALSTFLFSFYYSINYVNVPNIDQIKWFTCYGGMMKFLTTWNMVSRYNLFLENTWNCLS